VIRSAAATVSGDAVEGPFDGRWAIGWKAAWRVTPAYSGAGETWPVRSIFAVDRADGHLLRQRIEVDLDNGSVIVRQSCK